MVDALKLYPRGFLGAPLAPVLKIKPKPFESRLNALAVRVNIFTPQVATVDANPTVEALYGKWINRDPEMTSFEFRKKVWIAALAAFGTNNFFEWFYAQQASPAFGDMHRRFLEDTILFLQTGRRNLNLEAWTDLVTVQDSGDRSNVYSEDAKVFFGIADADAQYRRPQNRQLTEVIQRWSTHARGFDDLVVTLHLLFGNLT
ncbi:MAG: hypothetical protein P4L77_10830 [Sulfuriferula sp.]|nr:hypothetical protein [Sulfuriferula sp.]